VETADGVRASESQAKSWLRLPLNVCFFLPFLVTAIALFFVFQWTIAPRVERAMRDTRAIQMRNIAKASASSIDGYLEHQRDVIRMLADELAQSPSIANFETRLANVHDRQRAFKTFIAADATGVVVAAAPARDAEGRHFASMGHSVSDRPYFRESIAGREFVTGAFLGRALGNEPIVGVSAPVYRDGSSTPTHIVEGSLDLAQLVATTLLFERFPGVNVVVTDQAGAVVASTTPRYARLTNFRQSRRSGREQLDVITATAKTRDGFEIAVLSNEALVDATIRRELRYIGSVFAGGLLAAVLVVFFIGSRITRGLQRLGRVSTEAFVHRDAALLEGSPSRVREIDELREHLLSTFGTLEFTLSELERNIAHQDDVIATRTGELITANEKLDRLAATDGLTGLANYREFDRIYTESLRTAVRQRANLAVLMIDIDHFKAFNDIYGHEAGNECLKKVAGVLGLYSRRPLDVVARYGGEEFVIVLFDPRDDAVELIAEQLRNDVASLDLPHASSPFRVVTISIGCALASLSPDRDFDAARAGLLSVADAALYRAKLTRNEVVIAHA
jgi:diguanylate cyclase (GGDEF)-like protein